MVLALKLGGITGCLPCSAGQDSTFTYYTFVDVQNGHTEIFL